VCAHVNDEINRVLVYCEYLTAYICLIHIISALQTECG